MQTKELNSIIKDGINCVNADKCLLRVESLLKVLL